jgi:hypothetical protein
MIAGINRGSDHSLSGHSNTLVYRKLLPSFQTSRVFSDPFDPWSQKPFGFRFLGTGKRIGGLSRREALGAVLRMPNSGCGAALRSRIMGCVQAITSALNSLCNR